MNTLPLFFDLDNKSVLIIGGGHIAQRKALLLVKAGAKLVVLAKNFDAAFQDFLVQNEHTIIHKTYENNDLAAIKNKYNVIFAICATDDEQLNEQIYREAQASGMFINVVDNPRFCDFIFPAMVDRDPITIGISSGGKAPVLTRLIRAKIESVLPSNIGDIAQKAGKFRQAAKVALGDITQRRRFWEGIFQNALKDKPIGDLSDELAAFMQNTEQKGEVYLVGAGAGDPDLLTFKALRLMQQADVVLYDALVSDEILDLCRRDSDKIFVGKKRAHHSKTQAEINALLVKLAQEGKRVLRLKGGDPFVFGRGGEEMQACQQAGVPCQVVSGISSALAASSCAGIPLTHRGVATSVRFLTACYQTDKGFDGLKSAYQADETLVFYMGLHALDNLVANLCQDLPSNTPVAIVSQASLPTQQVLVGVLDNIVQKQAIAKLPAPAIIIVGQVVNLYQA